ncbi:hypothetical protein [Clostridium cochlearium]|uniref:hypothetical protein n=1 Tax=Clostridium cochlearium TaxID=1494 RepID=UPI0017A51AF5|nr:hypothetical protein [Clostridium cochlearium]NMA57813.1 hypothetical protein [Clostridium cochlearium]
MRSFLSEILYLFYFVRKSNIAKIFGVNRNSIDKRLSKSFNSQMNYTKVRDIPKYLTILPCKITPSGGGGVSVDKNKKSLTLKKLDRKLMLSSY